MKKIKIQNATAALAEYAQVLRDGPIVVTNRGKPIAALVPIKDVDMESLMLGTDPSFHDLIERSRKRFQEEGGISHEEICKEFLVNPPSLRNHATKTTEKKSKSKKRPAKAE